MQRNSPGFTLVELIVVLLLGSLMVSLVGVRIEAGASRLREREFMQGFVGSLRQARLIALRGGHAAAFRVDGAGRTYAHDRLRSRPIPDNADILTEGMVRDPATGEYLLVFFPDGSPSVRRLLIVFDGAREYDIRLDPLFGMVTGTTSAGDSRLGRR
ncbi:MAG: prepilin-type N-terminal cleavage/methylation domain-containing protein [Desulfovibrionaceae bacterium]|nr:prepilin-type N-terminal cleavage/methylation domain-containing protein [Desulfovibrionaceae bacterium]